MNGRRLDQPVDPVHFAPGDFGRWHGAFWARTPNGHLISLERLEVIEHADRTITVTKSLDVHDWQGELKKGTWHRR